MELAPNNGKEINISTSTGVFARYPVRSHIITDTDSIVDVLNTYVVPHLLQDDIVFISERIVAISQGRAYPIAEIHPSPLAKFLVRFVHKSPYGIGLGSPWTMELAIREAGAFRILFAALASAITKPFGLRGVFYHVVGNNINAIDGPCSYTLPPYNSYAKLGPARPTEVARELARAIGHEVIIIDANDLGAVVLGRSNKEPSDKLCKEIFKDNPLGQSTEQTPLCIVRKIR